MRNLIIILITVFAFYSCSNQARQKQKKETLIQTDLTLDTIIGSINITDELAGSSYRKRATGYFMVVQNDSSRYMPIFSESKNNGEIKIHPNFQYSNETKSYSQRLNELKLILPKAAKEYNLDSLKSMSIGRLLSSGDLAITITEEYKAKFGNTNVVLTEDYDKISNFLLESTLVKDLNKLLKPYSKVVSKVDIEKVFFTDKKGLFGYSKILRDTTNIPDKILDFTTWVEFKDE